MFLVCLSVSLLRSSFEWLSDQVTEWPSDQMTGWPNDWVTGWQEPWQSVEELKLELSSRKRHLKTIVLCNPNIVKHGFHVCLRLSAGLHYSLICAESALGSAGLTATLVTSPVFTCEHSPASASNCSQYWLNMQFEWLTHWHCIVECICMMWWENSNFALKCFRWPQPQITSNVQFIQHPRWPILIHDLLIFMVKQHWALVAHLFTVK